MCLPRTAIEVWSSSRPRDLRDNRRAAMPDGRGVMVYAMAPAGDVGGPQGYSYRAVVARAPRDDVLRAAVELRFTGWVGPQEGDDVVLVPERGPLAVAAEGRDLEAFGAELAAIGAVVLTAEVVRDRLLVLLVWTDGAGEPLRYLSDPSVLSPDEEDVLDEAVGADHGAAMALAFGRPEAAEEVEAALAEWLDPESYIESERLDRVLALLGLPTWPVSAWALPKAVSGGPRVDDMTRLGAGVGGTAGRVRGGFAGVGRTVRQKVTRRPDGPRRVDVGHPGPGAAPGEEGLWGSGA
jgi:hypothetical protein